MDISKVTAIIRPGAVEAVEEKLCRLGVSGLTTTTVKGFGEARKLFFSRDRKVSHTKVEVLVPADRAERIARAILDAAHTGDAGDGLVVVLPVERAWRVRTRSAVSGDDLA